MARSYPTPNSRFPLAFLAMAAVLFGTTACDSGPKVYPVKGKVVNKGKGNIKELAGYTVQFQSDSDPSDTPGGAIEEDGSFTLYTYTGVGGKVVPGVKQGTYRACLQPPAVEGGPPPKLIIPRRYTNFETANLQFTISPGPNDITIEVDRDAP
jgi:hypothetical protein